MAIQQAKLPSKNFRELIQGVLKFRPSTLPGGELINFAVNSGRARASIGVGADAVVSSGVMLAGSEIDPFSVDYRIINSYAGQLPDDCVVTVELSRKNKHVIFVCDKAAEARLNLAFTDGVVAPRPKVPDPFFIADEETAKVIKSLLSVAEKDEDKPDMSCIYLRNGMAMAGNQTCIALVRHPGLPAVELALPLNVCQVLEPGDKLSKTDKGLLLSSGNCVSKIPDFVQALRFPVAVVDRLEQATGDTYGTGNISHMRTVFKQAADCVARIPGVPSCMTLTFRSGGIQAAARNQKASYRKELQGTGAMDGQVLLELPEAEHVLDIFGSSDVTFRKLKPKGESLLEGGGAKAFFAPVNVIPAPEV